jgi:two-component system OmpR family response regulator
MGMRILLVEDEPDLAAVMAAAFQEEGYVVDVAHNGEDGLHLGVTSDYDAIVLDIMLPKLNGWQVLEGLRQRKRTPVLMLTARDALNDRVRGLDAGADDYLVKPFQLAELMARLRALIRRAAGQAHSRIDIGDICVDTAAKCAYREQIPLPLTAMEYSLLELLALHRGRLVSRTMIYEHLFDEVDISLSNNVDVHVSNLRKKLGRDIIKTRRGLGYLIDE